MSELPADAVELRLAVTGRTSGAKRQVRLWFVVLDGRLFVMAGEPRRNQWLRNVQANPRVEVELGGRTWQATATSANGGPDDAAIRTAFGEKYGTRYLQRWLAESHPVAIDRRSNG
jgi:deazaflavin-dependent oxidoreductase (nitroreductase family)